MKKLAPAGVALVLGLAMLAMACRGPIALRLMRAGAERAMAADALADLPDGLHVALCGAGGPLPDAQRSGPCVAVLAGRTLFVVDAGSGGARNLQQHFNWPAGRIEALFLTHYHSDHIDGIGELALQRWVQGVRSEPLPVYGPEGLDDVVAGINRAYRLDTGYRVAHHGPEVVPPDGAGLTAETFRAPAPGRAQIVWEDEEIRVKAFRVEHDPVDPAVGYRFDYAGRSLLVSGDTRKSESLLAQAKGVDLVVHEALSPELVGVMTEAAAKTGRSNLEKITVDILDYHTTPVEAAEIAEAAGAQHLLFYHVVPPMPLSWLEVVFLDGVSSAYSGGVTLGRDGTLISLPRNSDAVDVVED